MPDRRQTVATSGGWATAQPNPTTDSDHVKVTLSYAALCAVLAAGFVLALGQAETSPALTHLIATILH